MWCSVKQVGLSVPSFSHGLEFKISNTADVSYHYHSLTVPKHLPQSFEASILLMQL